MRSILLFAFAGIVLFTLSGCSYEYAKLSLGFDPTEINPNNCEKLDRDERKNICYNVVARNLKDHSLCYKIESERQRNICHSGLADALRNDSLCEEITSSFIKAACYGNFE